MPRGSRIDVPGLVYHVICRGIERREIFKDEKDYNHFLNLIGKNCGSGNFIVYAFVLMPNHVHILLRTISMPLSVFMRRLLTGYAVYFNRRHKRCGHLFQNRYKSFVVEEDLYLLELIRYIHLNPLRGGIVAGLTKLSRWQLSGYAALMGNTKQPWFEIEPTLLYFAADLSVARRRLAEFMYDGITHGRRSELTGGGLKRSLAASSFARQESLAYDERILGSGSFVEMVLHQTERSDVCKNKKISLENIIEAVAARYNLTATEFCCPTKRPAAVKARNATIWLGIKHLALSPAELSRTIGISPSTISGIIAAGKGEKESGDILLD